jgi:hypothetical protein
MRPTPRLPRLPLLLALGVLASGCAGRPVRARPAPGAGAGHAGNAVPLGWGPKRVVSKEPPGTLVASDGTVCRVDAARYERTALGKAAACSWQLATTPREP